MCNIGAIGLGISAGGLISNYTAARNLQMKGLQYSNELEGLRV